MASTRIILRTTHRIACTEPATWWDGHVHLNEPQDGQTDIRLDAGLCPHHVRGRPARWAALPGCAGCRGYWEPQYGITAMGAAWRGPGDPEGEPNPDVEAHFGWY